MNHTENTKTPIEGAAATNFIREAVAEDLKSGRFKSVHTRFPPEPNAYLHIGHAKAIWIDYGIAQEFGGLFNLRFDDTNPAREEQEFVDAIIQDVKWLGADFGGRLFFASDYFEQMYQWAEELIKKGQAYVCDLAAEEVSKTRGTLTEPGRNSPNRDRSVDENLGLFRRMKAGEFPDGSKTLRAKIDMTHPNLNLRDPVMYRILHTPHHRQGDKWCLYPMYDWAHGLEDSIEGITHSLCSLEYEDHRPLYDWFLDQLGIYHPRQIEFARLNLSYTVMSKRKFIDMVKTKKVTGYDDPRLSTLAGMRRRGFSSLAIKNFCERIGVAKRDSLVDHALLEHYVREDLNKRAPRYMGILNPVKVVITNYPEGQSEELEAVNNPEDPTAGTRKVPFSRELYLERDDFMEEPHKKFYRLSPGREVRLRWAYFITCTEAIKDASGNITELRCTYDPATKGGDAPDGRKVKATLHWVSAKHAITAEARLYDRLFTKENPDDAPEGQDFTANLNPDSLKVISDCKCEPALAQVKPGQAIQLERLAYFCVDPDSREGKLVLNRTVPLKESWGKTVKE
ncbi:MAG: glutamine--tRNA ligase/YqeY domain fusion protein [Candidatus Edwardsbacteria bacterium]|nr:glutamine--tRNA ligase/YqeY domain fusion protein [Candidatus Edwardsbacteria bacterium]